MSGRWLTAAEAAERLGVKRETLYAYVSRGLVNRHPSPGRRGSRFDAEEIEGLTRRARRADPPAGLDLVVATAVSRIDGGRLRYRGLDAAALAVDASFEAVAELLWGGEAVHVGFEAAEEARRCATAALSALPADARLVERFGVALAAAATVDPLRFDLSPAAVRASARTAIAVLVDGAGPPPRRVPALEVGGRRMGGTVAGRLWPRLTGSAGPGGGARLLNGTLVLMADHELATSTLAARVAASTRANPYAVLGAALGAVQGPLHAGASLAVHRLLVSAEASGPAPALGEVFRTGSSLPGFGHPLYPDGDPRAAPMLALLDASALPRRRVDVVRRVVDLVRHRAGTQPNCDLALGALAYCAGARADAGEAVFALARCAGWIAHALEEYQAPPLRYRGRALPVEDAG